VLTRVVDSLDGVSGDSERWPPVLRPIVKRQLNPRRAALIISAFTIFFALAGGILIRVFDKEDFPTIGDGLWWAIQTVTTVGYGDIVPKNTEGKAIAALVMLTGIAFIAVVTAAVTAALIETARRQLVRAGGTDAKLDEITRRLAAIESALEISETEKRD
jgi:voltage-gated potassium channel